LLYFEPRSGKGRPGARRGELSAPPDYPEIPGRISRRNTADCLGCTAVYPDNPWFLV